MVLLPTLAVASLAVQTCPVFDWSGHAYLIAAWKVKCLHMGGAINYLCAFKIQYRQCIN